MLVSKINYYLSKSHLLTGSNYREVKKQALLIIKSLERRTKRKAYLKSKYFKNQKVFINLFLEHLFDKCPKERMRRLKYLACGLELIKKSTYKPTIKNNPNKKEILYRFYGKTKNANFFSVQIKEAKSGEKYLMSIFPTKNLRQRGEVY